MRSQSRSIGTLWLILSALTIALAGCSSGGSQDTFSTASLSPRPYEGMRRDAPRTYPDGSTSGGTYTEGSYGRPYAEAPRRYVDPGQPTPREYASYNSGHGPYGSQNIQTGSLGASNNPAPYGQDGRWQQPDRSRWPQQPAPVTTGSVGTSAHAPQIVEVQEGDTLFSLSRRHNVPLAISRQPIVLQASGSLLASTS
jgi:hypothetical protein